jgi:hypothetical protein
VTKADVAELVDARDLKSLDGNVVWVRLPPPAPHVVSNHGTTPVVAARERDKAIAEDCLGRHVSIQMSRVDLLAQIENVENNPMQSSPIGSCA